jgi:2-polyprenyl-6-methoxyphenol hydroxylase-like FAD-dependent oxidoreductase
VQPRVVERRAAPHHEARGTALQSGTLDIIDRAGLIKPFLRASVHIRQVRLLGPGLREVAIVKLAGIGCKYEFQCSLPQWRTETILREHLHSVGVNVEYDTEVKSIEEGSTGLHVTIETDGGTESLAASYVLGAGGPHSVTRHSMQEHLRGETYDGRYIVADAKIRLSFPSKCGRIVVGPSGFVLFSPLPDERWLIFDEATSGRRDPDPEESPRPWGQSPPVGFWSGGQPAGGGPNSVPGINSNRHNWPRDNAFGRQSWRLCFKSDRLRRYWGAHDLRQEATERADKAVRGGAC